MVMVVVVMMMMMMMMVVVVMYIMFSDILVMCLFQFSYTMIYIII